jgi:hypothetical protein
VWLQCLEHDEPIGQAVEALIDFVKRDGSRTQFLRPQFATLA